MEMKIESMSAKQLSDVMRFSSMKVTSAKSEGDYIRLLGEVIAKNKAPVVSLQCVIRNHLMQVVAFIHLPKCLSSDVELNDLFEECLQSTVEYCKSHFYIKSIAIITGDDAKLSAVRLKHMGYTRPRTPELGHLKDRYWTRDI